MQHLKGVNDEFYAEIAERLRNYEVRCWQGRAGEVLQALSEVFLARVSKIARRSPTYLLENAVGRQKLARFFRPRASCADTVSERLDSCADG